MRVNRLTRVASGFLEAEDQRDAREAKQSEQSEVVHESTEARLLEDFSIEKVAGLRRGSDRVAVRGEGDLPVADAAALKAAAMRRLRGAWPRSS